MIGTGVSSTGVHEECITDSSVSCALFNADRSAHGKRASHCAWCATKARTDGTSLGTSPCTRQALLTQQSDCTDTDAVRDNETRLMCSPASQPSRLFPIPQ